jgi:hypothetical protein
MAWFSFTKKPPLTKTEAFVLARFPEAVAFAAQEWIGYDRYFQGVDPEWRSNSLSRRFAGFWAGTIAQSLEGRFPDVRVVAADADAHIGGAGHKEFLVALIAAEGVVASGTDSRDAVRALRAGAGPEQPES